MIMDLLNLQVEKSLDESTVKSMLLTLAKNYSSDIEVDFSEADAKKLTSFVMGEFAKQLSAGVKVESDKGVKFGHGRCSLGPAPSATFPRCKRRCPGQVG